MCSLKQGKCSYMFFRISLVYFRRLCISTLCTSLFIFLWGAWLRFSFSGDGCGTDWPLCNSKIIPATTEAWMEWIHRLSSSGFSILILCIVFYSFLCFPKKHRVRFWSLVAFALTVLEALIGAFLVIFSLTGHDQSILRPFVLEAHLINSLLLLASLVMCWRHSLENPIPSKKILKWSVLFILLALTGSIASLSNTLFPSSSLVGAFLMDFNFNSPGLVQLRILHPILTLLLGGGAVFYLYRKIVKNKITINLKNGFPSLSTEAILLLCLLLGLTTGIGTLLSLSPIFMKLTHLFIAYMIWIAIWLLEE